MFFILLISMEAHVFVITSKFTELCNLVPRTCHSSQNHPHSRTEDPVVIDIELSSSFKSLQ